MRLGDIPEWLHTRVVTPLLSKGILSVAPDQAIVNEYFPGQGASLYLLFLALPLPFPLFFSFPSLFPVRFPFPSILSLIILDFLWIVLLFNRYHATYWQCAFFWGRGSLYIPRFCCCNGIWACRNEERKKECGKQENLVVRTWVSYPTDRRCSL